MKSTTLFSLLVMMIHSSNASWGSPGSSQYHIQTDEGPERFFRYQTDNGQFRKEKRLQDGTVIGTNAWIDGFGYLRQNDYIADHAGYRILKAKTVFVGKDRSIEDAMKAAKKAPASSGILVPSHQSPPSVNYVTTTQRPISTTSTYSSSPGYFYPKSPNVFIQTHSQPDEGYFRTSNNFDQPAISIPSNDIQSPSVIYLPPYKAGTSNELLSSSTPAPKITDESHLPPIAYYPSSTESPLQLKNYVSSTTVKPIQDESNLPPIAYYPSSTHNPLDVNNVLPLASTPAPILANDLSKDLLPPKEYGVVSIQPKTRFAYRPTYQYQSTTASPHFDYSRNTIDSNSHQNPSNVPLFDRSKYQETPYYDGVGVTANGFRYYLPRQYQEEVSNNDGSRDGSFGYIDPFGIRRVIYYNAGRNGFIHRKNNRYVGLHSTPYDPRPN
ncbi:CLUMA_CG009197, isoform A [Clunio marinus]|uniref:CLUMA_CG009197, isoform A n=1 Tax=Clunio marinus TaxID=568069 RepID=A0A1J1I834_9DIPT|nr:CLUMA_CG009197, isoform A [Clunio marinus]